MLRRMVRSLEPFACAALLLASACNLQPSKLGGANDQGSAGADPSGDVEPERSYPEFLEPDFAARVASARQLDDTRPAELRFHDDRAFGQHADRVADRDGLIPTAVDTPAFQLAFGFALLAKVSSPPYAKTQREQLLAFYDRTKHVVHARRDARLAGGEAALRLVIAHELGHALQAQHFPKPDFPSIRGEDERLARLALLEGDAMLTMLAYQSHETFVPLTRSLALDSLDSGDVATFERASGMADEAEHMSALTRARLEFPYTSGLHFAGELFRAGGFELVNRAFEQPPVSTEQVLHPAQYLRGDAPVEVEVPKAPNGYQSVAEGTVGELLIRLALSSCNKTKHAVEAARGWGGDAYRIVEKDELAGLLWATTWDSPADAKEFERAVRQLAKCWELAQDSARSVFAGPARIERRGRHVAVQRGIPPHQAKVLSPALLKLPKDKPEARPPFGPIELRPRVDPPKLAEASRKGNRIVAPKMGVSTGVPRGYRVELSDIVTLLREEPNTSRIVMSLSGLVVNDSSLEVLYEGYATAVQGELSQPLVVDQHKQSVETPIGTGTLRSWRVGATELRFKLLVLPVCNNTGSLLVAFAGEDDTTTREHFAWLKTLKLLPDNSRGLCRALDP